MCSRRCIFGFIKWTEEIHFFHSQLSASNFMDIMNLYLTEVLNKSMADDLIDKIIEDPTAKVKEVRSYRK